MTDAARETGASARATVDWFNFFDTHTTKINEETSLDYDILAKIQ